MPDQSFIDELAKRIQKIATKAVPCGTVCAFLRGHVPEGWLLLNGQKVYQKAHANLYEVLSGLSNLAKGSDTTGAYVVLPDMDGRVLQGTSDAGQVGKLLEAQLPNITGTFSAQQLTTGAETANATASGALFVAESRSTEGSTGTYSACCAIGLDASKGDATYSGSKVQAQASLVLLCIKI